MGSTSSTSVNVHQRADESFRVERYSVEQYDHAWVMVTVPPAVHLFFSDLATLDGLASTSEGRRIHDLRHTAACLWLARGVDVVTVQAWMGHASVATTNLYLHHLGTSADRAGLDPLNRPGHTGSTPEADRPESHGSES